MAKPQQFMLVMVSTVAVLTPVSGTVEAVKYVCPGDSVQIFKDIDYDHCNAVISLSVNGRGNVAFWSFKNCTLNATIIKEYKNRLFHDRNGTITISKLHQFDHGRYVVIAKTDTPVPIKEVEIYVMDAPRKNCKPKIEQFGNALYAALPSVGCGNPVTTLYWRNVSHTTEPVLMIVEGEEPRAYYACIEGPALRCTQSLTPQDYCSTYVIEERKTFDNRGIETNITFIVVAINAGIILIVVIGVLICIKHYTNKRNAALKSVPINRHKSDSDTESELQKLQETDVFRSLGTGEAVNVNASETKTTFQSLQKAFLYMGRLLNQVPEEHLTFKMPEEAETLKYHEIAL